MLQIKQLNTNSRGEWLVEKRYTFGAGGNNHYQITGAGIAEIHAGLEVDGDKLTLVNLAGGQVRVNGEDLEQNRVLKVGDEFTVGNQAFKLEDPKQNRKPPRETIAALSDWSLKAKNTALANKSIVLQGVQTIGRSKDCDICLNVVHLSRRHAQISVGDDYLQIDDLNSSNGTYLNGKRVTSARVRAGDELRFDTLKFAVYGPSSSLDKTQVRQESLDSDATTMRPMIKESDLKEAARKPASKSRKPREHIALKVKETEAPASVSIEPKGNTGAILLGVVVLSIVAAAAYIFLG